MAVSPGTRLDHYEILAPIGAGGMGEVYRARDTKLNREVAIKILTAEFSLDTERLRRFEQEARATGMLNHPNILTVHDVGRYGSAPYIVTELLEGEELRAPLRNGPLSVRKAIEYAVQISRGLAAAHEKGIVHRDLKPENIFITRDNRIKILDFGIAKFITPPTNQTGSDQTEVMMTTPGTVFGTMGYMAPEQLRAQATDHRIDIFAFGAMLYEMLSGQRPFTGNSQPDVMSAILNQDPPDLSELNPQVSPGLERIVRRCLEKKPEHRFQSADDLGFALEALTVSPSGASGQHAVLETRVMSAQESAVPDSFSRLLGRRLPAGLLGWLAAAFFLLVGAGFAVAYFLRPPAETAPMYSYLLLPKDASSAREALSPDGRRLVMAAVTEGINRLWLYSFDSPAPVVIPNTEGGRVPFWSPDGTSIGFFAQGKLKRIAFSGGPATTICDAVLGYGGAWSKDGVIVFAPAQFGRGLYRVPESGGTPTPVTSLDATRLETGHIYPSFLPDGRHFVFLATSGQPDQRGIRAGSIDQQQSNFFVRSDSNGEYSSAGYLLFVRGRRILAQKLDASNLSLKGDPFPVSERVNYELAGRYADLSVFSNRLLAYRSGETPNSKLVWVDRAGKELSTVGPPAEGRSASLSSDGRYVVLERNDPQFETSDLWLLDLPRDTATRLTSNPANESRPIWSANGSAVAYASERDGLAAIWQKGVTGDGKESLLVKEDRSLIPSDWSKNDEYLVYWGSNDKTGDDIKIIPVSGDRTARAYLATQFDEQWGKVSPDGKWMAYQSNDSGRFDIYVQPFPVPGSKVKVSPRGGSYPFWRKDGKELYYISPDDKLMAVPVQSGAEISAGTPVALFEIGSYGRRNNVYTYQPAVDGQRFLVIKALDNPSTRPLTLLQNLTSLFKKSSN